MFGALNTLGWILRGLFAGLADSIQQAAERRAARLRTDIGTCFDLSQDGSDAHRIIEDSVMQPNLEGPKEWYFA